MDSLTEFIEAGMGDCQVQSISWLPNQEDIQIGFLLDEGSSKLFKRENIIIQFTWASNLKIDMDFGDYSGMGLTWEVKIKKQTSKEWRVNIEFGGCPDGAISFNCSSFKLVEKD